MNVGESVTVVIYARDRWNSTGVSLEAGAEYHFESSGIWFDSRYRATADGYSTPTWFHGVNERFLNFPGANWCSLIGSLDKRRANFFLIGRHCNLTPTVSGELLCFANDAPWLRWNNRGEVDIRITRRS